MIKEAVLIFISAVAGSSLAALLVYKDIWRRLKQHEQDIDDLYRRTGPTRERTWSR